MVCCGDPRLTPAEVAVLGGAAGGLAGAVQGLDGREHSRETLVAAPVRAAEVTCRTSTWMP